MRWQHPRITQQRQKRNSQKAASATGSINSNKCIRQVEGVLLHPDDAWQFTGRGMDADRALI